MDAGYCDFLRKADARVPFTQGDKSVCPFVGVLLEINEMKYYAPLSSPKPKHLKMGNQLDFLKINGGKLGAINFNNMIPVHATCLTSANLIIGHADGRDERAYKNLLADQLSWCNRNRNEISARAMKLYVSSFPAPASSRSETVAAISRHSKAGIPNMRGK
ncbi:MAG: type III toxin-antitoxin system ToxN/AbiQ family toxin [Clostridiales Family XIII bacterium]|nr:type III toxin-antitoxin system ToxN/AbiQ family toxin [Clostridiales Family XIII bacterium]